MIVRSKKSCIIQGAIFTSLFVIVTVWMMYDMRMDSSPTVRNDDIIIAWWILCLTLLYADIVMLDMFVLSQLRILIFDKEGCTVQWLWMVKRHNWKDLHTKKNDYWVSRRSGYEGILFSAKTTKKLRKSRKIFESIDYLNDFYVIFYENDKKSISYPAKRNEFISMLKNWEVELEKGRELVLKERRENALIMGMKKRKERIEAYNQKKNKNI